MIVANMSFWFWSNEEMQDTSSNIVCRLSDTISFSAVSITTGSEPLRTISLSFMLSLMKETTFEICCVYCYVASSSFCSDTRWTSFNCFANSFRSSSDFWSLNVASSSSSRVDLSYNWRALISLSLLSTLPSNLDI